MNGEPDSQCEGRTLLIIAGGYWQVPVVKRAKKLGLRVVVADRSPNAPCMALSDASAVVDARDLEALVRLARKHRVDGVIAEQTDVAVQGAAYVAEALALPGISYETALKATSKYLMRQTCEEARIRGPRFCLTNSAADAVAAVRNFGCPAIIKPVDAQASRGVFKIGSLADVGSWFELSASQSSDRISVLVEEMMTGIEISVDCIVSNGEVTELASFQKRKTDPPLTYDLELTSHPAISEGSKNALSELNRKVIAAMGIDMGLTHGEYIVTSDGPRLVEIAARGCGAGIATTLVEAMTGFSPIEGRIFQAVGFAPPVTLTRDRHGILQFLVLPEGFLQSIDGLDSARTHAGIVGLDIFPRPGDMINPPRSGGERHGYIMSVGDSPRQARSALEEAMAAVQWEIN